MKAVAMDAAGLVATGDGQQARGLGQVAMKGRIKARDLRETGKAPKEGLGQLDLFRQMLGVKGLKLVQRLYHFRRDALRLRVARAPMNNAVSDSCQFAAADALLEPIHKDSHGRLMIWSRDRLGNIVGWLRALGGYVSRGRPDALDLAIKDALHGSIGLKQRKLDAGGTAIDRKDTCWEGFHGY